jgi:hypothetical protein
MITERFKYLHMHIINIVQKHKILGGEEGCFWEEDIGGCFG